MFERELDILMVTDHSTIISFIGHSLLVFQDENYITIIIDFAKKGSLADVTNLTQDAFYDCKHFRFIEFYEKSELKIIQPKSFQSTKIENILIPPQVVSIEVNIFEYCEKLKYIQFYEHSKLQNIDSNAFNQSPISSISFPCTVKLSE